MRTPLYETYGNDTLRSILDSVNELRRLLSMDDEQHTLGMWDILDALEKDIKHTLWVRGSEDK